EKRVRSSTNAPSLELYSTLLELPCVISTTTFTSCGDFSPIGSSVRFMRLPLLLLVRRQQALELAAAVTHGLCQLLLASRSEPVARGRLGKQLRRPCELRPRELNLRFAAQTPFTRRQFLSDRAQPA